MVLIFALKLCLEAEVLLCQALTKAAVTWVMFSEHPLKPEICVFTFLKHK